MRNGQVLAGRNHRMTTRMNGRQVALALATMIVAATPAQPCSMVCSAKAVLDHAKAAESIMVGRVVRIEQLRDVESGAALDGIASVKPTRVLKGKEGAMFRVEAGPAESCGYPMRSGEEHLLFLRPSSLRDGVFTVVTCSPSGLTSNQTVAQALKEVERSRQRKP